MSLPSIDGIARALGGVVTGADRCSFHPPGHRPSGPYEASLILGGEDGFTVTCFSPRDDWRDVKDWVRDRLGLDHGYARRTPDMRPTKVKPAAPVDRVNRDNALSLWHEADDPRGTPAEMYLRSRGHEIPEEAAGVALRWHPSCPFGPDRVGVMVALVRDVVTDEPKAIHRTAIDKNGKKLSHLGANGRLTLGPCGGGAVKLSPNDTVTLCLGVGEGIESTLSLRHVREFGVSPVWALLSAGQVAALPVLGGVETLWLAVDHDPAGVKASQGTAERWVSAGRESYLIAPTTAGADLNDMEAAHAA